MSNNLQFENFISSTTDSASTTSNLTTSTIESSSSFQEYQKAFTEGMKNHKVNKIKKVKKEVSEKEEKSGSRITSCRMEKFREMPKFKDTPQNFNIAKKCPEEYLPCPRGCNLYILKQHKLKHTHSAECHVFAKMIADGLVDVNQMEEQLRQPKDQKWRKKRVPNSTAFFYGYTNQRNNLSTSETHK